MGIEGHKTLLQKDPILSPGVGGTGPMGEDRVHGNEDDYACQLGKEWARSRQNHDHLTPLVGCHVSGHHPPQDQPKMTGRLMTEMQKNNAFLTLVPETGFPSKPLIHQNNSSVPATGVTAFDRHELRALMQLYGRQVASGEWRDYAMDFLPDLAVFSVFKRANEVPVFRLEKMPKYARM